MPGGPKRIAIIGNGKIARECAEILKNHPDQCCLACVVIDASRNESIADLKNFCIRNDITHQVSKNINNDGIKQFLRSNSIELIFSINNHQVIREELLALAPEGIINFHNGPLPRYGGLNACTWAIFNGETHHGVTWHYVANEVDSGDIIAQRLFDIRPDMTALQLVMTSITEGIALFKQLLPEILAGDITRSPQNPAQRLYYFERMRPENGKLDFTWDYEKIDRLVRALNYNPLESKLGAAYAYANGKKFFVDKVALVSRQISHTPAEVVQANSSLHIQTHNAIIQILEVRNEHGQRISIKQFVDEYGLETSTTLV
jgi:methionyl-tRNA formyltransferase